MGLGSGTSAPGSSSEERRELGSPSRDSRRSYSPRATPRAPRAPRRTAGAAASAASCVSSPRVRGVTNPEKPEARSHPPRRPMDASRELRRGFDADFSASSVSGSAKRRPETLRAAFVHEHAPRARAAVPVRPCARARAGEEPDPSPPGKRRRGLSLKLALPGEPRGAAAPFPTGGGADAGSAGDGVSKSCWVPKVARAARSMARRLTRHRRARRSRRCAPPPSSPSRSPRPSAGRAPDRGSPRAARGSAAAAGAAESGTTGRARNVPNGRGAVERAFLKSERSPFRTAPPNRTDASRPASRPAAPRGTPSSRRVGHPACAPPSPPPPKKRASASRASLSAPSPQSSSRRSHERVEGHRRREVRDGGGAAAGFLAHQAQQVEPRGAVRNAVGVRSCCSRLGFASERGTRGRHVLASAGRAGERALRLRKPPEIVAAQREEIPAPLRGLAPEHRARAVGLLRSVVARRQQVRGVLAGRRRVQALAQEHGVGHHVVVQGLADALAEEGLQVPIVVARRGRRRHSGGAGRARAVSRSDGDGRRGRARDARRVVRVRASRVSVCSRRTRQLEISKTTRGFGRHTRCSRCASLGRADGRTLFAHVAFLLHSRNRLPVSSPRAFPPALGSAPRNSPRCPPRRAARPRPREALGPVSSRGTRTCSCTCPT